MKSTLTFPILLAALALGGVAAEGHPIRHHDRHSSRHLVRYEHHRRGGLRRLVARATAESPAVGYETRTGGLRELVARTAAENGVPYGLANAVVTIESRYNPRAAHGGALGLMQIKAQTARGVGFQGSAASLFNPSVNLQYGMRYLALAYRESGGNLCATVMRYQSGTAARHMSAANRTYCARASSLIGRS